MIRLIVDSTADMTPEVAARVSIVPLTIRFGDREYTPGVDMDTRRFYELLEKSPDLPTTSQASPFAFQKAFQQATEGGDQAVCLTCSGKLSGTYQSACIAAEDFPGRVWVVDSQTIALGLGILAEYALKTLDSVRDPGELARLLERKRRDIRLLARLDTLEYLKRGGRISASTAAVGSLLNIKPVVTIEGGQIRMLGKARGSRQANNLLVQQIEAAGGVDFDMPLLLGYTGTSDTLLRDYIADSAALWQHRREKLNVSMVGSVVGTHTGPGAVAVAFFARNGVCDI